MIKKDLSLVTGEANTITEPVLRLDFAGRKQKKQQSVRQFVMLLVWREPGIHNLIQIEGLVWLAGRLRQDNKQASGW